MTNKAVFSAEILTRTEIKILQPNCQTLIIEITLKYWLSLRNKFALEHLQDPAGPDWYRVTVVQSHQGTESPCYRVTRVQSHHGTESPGSHSGSAHTAGSSGHGVTTIENGKSIKYQVWRSEHLFPVSNKVVYYYEREREDRAGIWSQLQFPNNDSCKSVSWYYCHTRRERKLSSLYIVV